MRSAQIHELTGPDALRVTEIDEPKPSSDQVLIEVAAAGVAFPDLLLSRGLYQLKPPPPFVPGSEVSGTVVSAPDNSGLTPGDRFEKFFCNLISTSSLPRFQVDLEVAASIEFRQVFHCALRKNGATEPRVKNNSRPVHDPVNTPALLHLQAPHDLFQNSFH